MVVVVGVVGVVVVVVVVVETGLLGLGPQFSVSNCIDGLILRVKRVNSTTTIIAIKPAIICTTILVASCFGVAVCILLR